MTEVLLEIKDMSCSTWSKDQAIFSNVSFIVNEGDIVVLQGKSGCGKTTLLKCLAHLNVYDGQLLYRGRTPKSYGIPSFRTHVLYVPQRPSLLPGTPRDFVNTLWTFGARKSQSKLRGGGVSNSVINLGECTGIAESWGLDEDLWDREWSSLSGGEAQRFALAVAVGLNSEILLLDEPTSALDPETSNVVEKRLIDELHSPDSALMAIVWVTHSEEQGHRVGTRFFHITTGGCHEDNIHLSGGSEV